MSKATKALSRACEKLEDAYDDAEYVYHDCALAAVELSQDDYNTTVDEYEGDEGAARKCLAKRFKADLKTMTKDLNRLSDACCAVLDALPAVAEEQLAALEEFEYTGEDEPDYYDAHEPF